jgi:chaperonin cofactor prefoldin
MPAQAIQPQSIEELRKRFDDLNTKRITAEANHKNAQKQLDELKAAAKAQWGTDNLDELRTRLKELEDENERKRSEYQVQLDKIEADLKQVDGDFAQAQEKR